MTRLSRIATVWENPEAAYQDHLAKGGKLTRREFIRKIAFIKDDKFNNGLLYGVLGAEVASYGKAEHEEMNTIKNVVTSVASYLLADSSTIGDDLSTIVSMALKKSIMSEISEESRFSFEDCYLLKNSGAAHDLTKIMESGIFDTAVFYDADSRLQSFPMEMQHNNYFYAADHRDLAVFVALYEAGLIIRSDFLDKVFTYINTNSDRMKTDRGFAFVDSSLVTKQSNVIFFAGKEYGIRNDSCVQIADISYVEATTQGAYQTEHLIFCGV